MVSEQYFPLLIFTHFMRSTFVPVQKSIWYDVMRTETVQIVPQMAYIPSYIMVGMARKPIRYKARRHQDRAQVSVLCVTEDRGKGSPPYKLCRYVLPQRICLSTVLVRKKGMILPAVRKFGVFLKKPSLNETARKKNNQNMSFLVMKCDLPPQIRRFEVGKCV